MTAMFWCTVLSRTCNIMWHYNVACSTRTQTLVSMCRLCVCLSVCVCDLLWIYYVTEVHRGNHWKESHSAPPCPVAVRVSINTYLHATRPLHLLIGSWRAELRHRQRRTHVPGTFSISLALSIFGQTYHKHSDRQWRFFDNEFPPKKIYIWE